MNNRKDKYSKPPVIARRLLKIFARFENKYSIDGDFAEEYYERIQINGKISAWFWFWRQFLFSFPFFIYDSIIWSLAMFKNYFKIALRNLIRYKGYAFLNISGLAIGMVCCLFLLIYIQDELNYDKFHRNSEQIYRVICTENKDGNIRHIANTWGPLRTILKSEFPEIIHTIRFFPSTVVVKTSENIKFQEDNFFYTDSTVFDIFSFNLKIGDPGTALKSPYSVVLTESTAKKYFGDTNPIGKFLNVENKYNYEVTGIIEDIPHNSHLHFDFLASIYSLKDFMEFALGEHGWHFPAMYTYVLLETGVNPVELQNRFPQLIEKHVGKWMVEERSLQLQPLEDIYLRSNLESEIEPVSNILYVYIYSTIAFFILLIACINFINMSTAKSAVRKTEVGMRKVLGAHRIQIAKQFFSESIFYTIVAVFLAILLVLVSLPSFNALVGKNISISNMTNLYSISGVVLLIIFVGIISGSYPSFVLSACPPIQVVQNRIEFFKRTGSNIKFRDILVLFQFAISISLISITLIIKLQLGFIQNKSLGFNREQTIIMPVLDEDIQNDWETVQNELLTYPGVTHVTATSTIPGIEREMDFPIRAQGLSENSSWEMKTMLVDFEFIQTFGMELIKGRNFSKARPSDKNEAFILNESAVKKLGWENPLGKRFEMDNLTERGTKKGFVIGVVKDFHFQSLHYKIDPLVLQIYPESYYLDNLAIRIQSQNMAETLGFIKQVWNNVAPHRPFEYSFLDETLGKIYVKENKLEEIFRIFAALAITIGCLGLLGLTSFTTERRSKEIGIRKVLGASIPNIVFLLSKEVTKWVILANLLAWPLTYYIMNRWLQNFAYHISIDIFVFVITSFMVLLVALLTVSYQSIKAALADPVKSLKYE